MFNIFKRKTQFMVLPTSDGRFGIFKGDTAIETYSRRRDAIRGATRKGITLANA